VGAINTPPPDSARSQLEGRIQAPEIVAAVSMSPANVTAFSPPTEIEEVPTTPFPTNASENPSYIPLPASPPLHAATGTALDVEPIDKAPSGVAETPRPPLPDGSTERETASRPNVVPNREEPQPDIESAPSSVDQREECGSGAPQSNLPPLKIAPQQPADPHSNGDAPAPPTVSASKLVSQRSLYRQPPLLTPGRNREPRRL
jgi:hypothetical protein